MFTVCALYHFTPFDDLPAIQKPLAALCCGQGITGSLLLAPEGINGTVAGSAEAIDRLIAYIRALPGCADLDYKLSTAQEQPFGRMKVRLKREIVTMGQPDVDPRAGTGHYCTPEEWNDLIRQDDVVVIDTRNDYEVAIGTFEGAVDPHTTSFREFPAWWEENRERFHNKRVAMFCTGGIRCEKSTNYLLGQGVEDVFHLKGGILKYLEEIPAEESLWQGECFVFDGRVSVGHGLVEGPHEMCHACRRPILPEDKAGPEYEEGVSCHLCAGDYDADRRERFRERQRQIALARSRGDRHLGPRDPD
ncbi:rhodanese-related sulfurtransferase [Maritimibacter sp. DP1N21-5]|uniref:oxygen-dependent tRNA uridine(34) hydroxylase TrhO n=1 Tax=Maritimibacter sp. DP1N21-5 TaxID=2836867 RepID=UPI001C477D8D|nr:rhodanese-related sulfurtransferase [Maritimibacter sp. DP1N21-5]MBV7407765.1 rhodanese-related sulfurtransferase [Maritimibacter sp. DP1N21-5]